MTVTEANNARQQQIHPSLVGLSHINKAKPNQEVRNFILSKIEQLPILKFDKSMKSTECTLLIILGVCSDVP